MGTTFVELVCSACGGQFQRRLAEVNQANKRGHKTAYCSRACVATVQKERATVTATCRYCAEVFSRRSNGRKERAAFCSQRCSARYRSANRRGSYSGPTCPTCGGRKHEEGNECRSCYTARIYARTLQEIRDEVGLAAYHAKVRGFSRKMYGGTRVCAACGYDIHVDICHIRAVADFPMTATLAEVNSPDNLVALDKRCHWEFDHGYLERTNDGRFAPVRR